MTWGPEAVEEAARVLQAVGEPRSAGTALQRDVAALEELALGLGRDRDPIGVDVDRSWFAQLTLVVVDAVLARDKRCLDDLEQVLSRVHRAWRRELHHEEDLTLGLDAGAPDVGQHEVTGRGEEDPQRWEGWLLFAGELNRAAMERLAPVSAATIVRGTHAERFLRIVADHPGISSREVGKKLSADRNDNAAAGRPFDEGQLSRIGKQLRTQGLLHSVRTSRGHTWELSPRGELVVSQLLGRSDSADAPVAEMLVTSSVTTADDVAAVVAASEPRKVAFLAHDEVVTYMRRDVAAGDVLPITVPQQCDSWLPVAASLADSTSGVAAAALADLLHGDTQHAPATLALSAGLVYDHVSRA